MTEPKLQDSEFRVLLSLMMVCDPWPLLPKEDKILLNLLDKESKAREFENWIVAYHEFHVPLLPKT